MRKFIVLKPLLWPLQRGAAVMTAPVKKASWTSHLSFFDTKVLFFFTYIIKNEALFSHPIARKKSIAAHKRLIILNNYFLILTS
ncbi:hypothetical protein A7975_09835 [Bacillus sp. FJAT-26390]|nr:hypothetical protein A7975_09835 [Bacillus sp. FJAT-26390]